MKKMFAKLGMPSILSVVFLLGGLFFGAGEASAQATMTGSQANSPIKNASGWKSVDDAKDVLKVEIDGWTNLLNTGNPSDPHKIKMKLLVYEGIVTSLEGGMSVPNAAHLNYYQHAPGAHVDTPNTFGMSLADWTVIYNDMITLLSL